MSDLDLLRNLADQIIPPSYDAAARDRPPSYPTYARLRSPWLMATAAIALVAGAHLIGADDEHDTRHPARRSCRRQLPAR